MDLNLAGKTALITGGSKGIGLAVARLLAAEGCSLHLAARTEADLIAARDELNQTHGAQVTIHAADLSDGDRMRQLASDTAGIDILVNNAGAIPFGNIEMVDETTWRNAWDLKVLGYVNLVRAVYPAMVARKAGVIVNILGTAGERPTPSYLAGSMGNASLMAMTVALGGESVGKGVRVVGVNPGLVETDRMVTLMRTRAASELGDADRWPELTKGLPLGRAAKADEVGDLVTFLASDRASYISGVIYSIDGGVAAHHG